MITICFTFFTSLTLANLDAALFSVRRQDLRFVREVVVVDNNTEYQRGDIWAQIAAQRFPVPVRLLSFKHGDATKAQAWSTNVTVREVDTTWVFYTRADYLLDFGILGKCVAVVDGKPSGWDGFVVSHGRHLSDDVAACEAKRWREGRLQTLPGVDYDYTEVDSGVWMMRRETFDRVGGFDERLSAWGHAQTEFQHRVYKAGVEFVRIPETLFYHPQHGGAKDMGVADAQLAAVGTDLKLMWARYHGASPYA